MLDFDPGRLLDRLRSLGPPGRLAFAASCAERLLPLYVLAERVVQGEGWSREFEDAISACWPLAAGKATELGAGASAERVRRLQGELYADPRRFRTGAVSGTGTELERLMEHPALAVECALRCALTGDATPAAEGGQLAFDTVRLAVLHQLPWSWPDPGLSGREVVRIGRRWERQAREHPLAQRELELQDNQLTALDSAAADDELAYQLRAESRSEGLILRDAVVRLYPHQRPAR